MPPLDPKRIYLRLIDEPPVAASSDVHVEKVRAAVERLAQIRWEKGYPKANPRGGVDVVFHLNDPPDRAAFERWIQQLDADGYHPVI